MTHGSHLYTRVDLNVLCARSHAGNWFLSFSSLYPHCTDPIPSIFTPLSTVFQTYIGQVLVSVNPFRDLPIYTPEVIQEYQKTLFFDAPPHM